jgi:hypothetical protein
MAVEQTADTDWGVTVEEVSALAPHVTIGEAPAAPVDDTFYIPADRAITVNEVQGFIRDAAARVSLRLANLTRITDAGQLSTVAKAAHDATVNGAAWYLVTAAFPIGQVNDNSAYAEVLRARFETALDTAGGVLDGWVLELANGGGSTQPHTFASSFPATSFPDAFRL